jgi:muramidase (phage lysozyme)
MGNRKFHHTHLLPATGYEVPLALTVANSRPGRKPGREGGGLPAPSLTALAAVLFFLISLCGAQGAHASTSKRVEKLRIMYSLDESVGESDGRLMRRKLLLLLSRSDVKLFLKVIQSAEDGEPNLMVGGCRAPNLKQHPALVLPKSCRYPVKGWGDSSASGSYQILLSNWEQIAPFLGLRDFSETNQALAALELIRRGGGAAAPKTAKGLALKQRIQSGFLKLLQGEVDLALCMATYDWASSSCSTLPAKHKIIYARRADEIRKKEAAERLQARRSEKGERLQSAREKGKASLRSSGHAGKADSTRTKGTKANCFAARSKA